MANLPPKPESPVKDDRRLDRTRDPLTPARPMAPLHYRSDRFPDAERAYLPRPPPDTDTYIASYDSRRDPRDRERDRDREFERRRDRDRDRDWDRDRDFRHRDWRDRERNFDWRRERDDRYSSRRGYSPRRYEPAYRRPASRSPPPRSRSRSPPPPLRRRSRSRSRSPLPPPPPRRYSRSRSRSRSHSPRRTRPPYFSQVRSRPYSPRGRRSGPTGRSRTPSPNRSRARTRTHTRSRSPSPSSKQLRLGNHSISDSPKIANASRSRSRGGQRGRSNSRSPRSPTLGRSVKREESKDRPSKLTSPILRSQPLVSDHPEPIGEVSKHGDPLEPGVKTEGLDEPMPLSTQSEIKIESKEAAAPEQIPVAPLKPDVTSPYIPATSSTRTRNSSPLPPSVPRGARSPSPPKGPRASLATQSTSTPIPSLPPTSLSTASRRTSRSPPKGPRNHSSYSSYSHSHPYTHAYQHSSYPHPSAPTASTSGSGGSIPMASGPMYPTGPRASRRPGSGMTPTRASTGTSGEGGAGSVAPIDPQSQQSAQSQPDSIMYWKHVLPPYERAPGGRFGIAHLETELARLQTARANYNHEFEQVARSTRRALHELDMATIDLRMAENRRKVADLQLEKAKHGVLGVDAAAAVVIDASASGTS